MRPAANPVVRTAGRLRRLHRGLNGREYRHVELRRDGFGAHGIGIVKPHKIHHPLSRERGIMFGVMLPQRAHTQHRHF